jgi:hypothetical protein
MKKQKEAKRSISGRFPYLQRVDPPQASYIIVGFSFREYLQMVPNCMRFSLVISLEENSTDGIIEGIYF